MEDLRAEQLEEHHNDIRTLFKQFKPERRIIFYDIEEGKLFAFEVEQFEKTLNEHSRNILKKQYKNAIKNNQIVIFVADSRNNTLKSFSIDETKP